MMRVFNIGLGLVIAVDPADAAGVLATLPGATAVGQVVPRGAGPAVVVAPAEPTAAR